jgi:hypothetical protein
MKVAPVDGESKHLFEKTVDTEQVFVMGCRHDEHRFDDGFDDGLDDWFGARPRRGHGREGVTAVPYNVGDDDGKDPSMTALLTAPLQADPGYEPVHPARPELRLVRAPEYRSHRLQPAAEPVNPAGTDRLRVPRRRASMEVRRRRTLLAMMGLALAVLALPLGGSGGHSHATGSVLAANGGPVLYTVRAGDSLWSIAERMEPSVDPRPLVAQLASETGSYTVVPGEQITLP